MRKDRLEERALRNISGNEIPRLNPALRTGVLPAGESLFDDPYAHQLDNCPIKAPRVTEGGIYIEPRYTMVGTLRSRPTR